MSSFTIFNVFGTQLSELAGMSSGHGMGLLRLAVKDAGKDPDAVLTYQDMKLVIQTHVSKRLVALKVPNVDSVVSKLLASLNEKQSLFTAAAR